MSARQRVKVRVGDIVFRYAQPQVSVDTDARTVTHQPIDEAAIVQYLGPETKKILIRGHCYLDEANAIDELTEKGNISMRSDRFTGNIVVTNTSTDPRGAMGGIIDDWEYDYTIDAIETRKANFGRGGN